MVGIYIIKNKVTKQYYVGESRDIEKRWKQHKRELNKGTHHSKKLQAAWNEYGEQAFTFKVVQRLWFCDNVNKEKLDIILYLREEYYMDKYNSLNFGYNMANTIGALLKYYNTGKSNKQFNHLKKYKRFCTNRCNMAQHYYHPLIIAMSYNPLIAIIVCICIFMLFYILGLFIKDNPVWLDFISYFQ